MGNKAESQLAAPGVSWHEAPAAAGAWVLTNVPKHAMISDLGCNSMWVLQAQAGCMDPVSHVALV